MRVARAAVFERAGAPLWVGEVEAEPPRAGEVSVRVEAAGLCGTDLSVMSGALPFPAPAVLGHEGAGVVEAVGPGVSSAAPGDRVVFLWRADRGEGPPAGGASRLRRGGEALGSFLGVSAFAAVAVVPESAVLKVDPDLPAAQAALLGCSVTTGVGAVLNAARVRPGATVAVFGAGGVGLNVVQGARLAGASTIVAVDRVPARLETALRLGATHVVDSGREDPVAAARELTAGGADYCFEAAGGAATLEQAWNSLRRGGTCVAVGVPPGEARLSLRPDQLVFEERTLTGSFYGSGRAREDIPRLVRLWRAGELELGGLVTRTYPLERINEACEDLRRGELARGVILP